MAVENGDANRSLRHLLSLEPQNIEPIRTIFHQTVLLQDADKSQESRGIS